MHEKGKRLDWNPERELLSQIVEEVSILASDHRRKKPRIIPRPGDKKKKVRGRNADGSMAPDPAGMKKAVGVLFGSKKKVMGRG